MENPSVIPTSRGYWSLDSELQDKAVGNARLDSSFMSSGKKEKKNILLKRKALMTHRLNGRKVNVLKRLNHL